MEEKNNNIVLAILLVLFGILAGIALGYFMYTKNNDNTNDINIKETEKKETKEEDIIVKFETTKGEYENVITKMTINDVDVLNLIEVKEFFADSEIKYDANSKFAIISIEEYSTGYINHHLYIFNSLGKLVKSVGIIKDTDFDYGYGYTGNFKFDKVNSIIQYDIKLVYDETGCGYEYKGKCFKDLSKETISALGTKEDGITYEIKYSKNETIANPEKKSTTLLKDNLNYKSYLNT